MLTADDYTLSDKEFSSFLDEDDNIDIFESTTLDEDDEIEDMAMFTQGAYLNLIFCKLIIEQE